MSTTDWVSAHVFFHGDLDTLLVDLVTPLTTDMVGEGLTRRFFFLRYWDGGPHVRLRVLPAERRSGDEVRDYVARRCGEYLRRHPAPDGMSEEEYARSAALLARREAMTPVPRMYPNNSVEFIPYVREVHRFGEGVSIQAVERHFAESSRIALELLSTRPSPEQRDTGAFTLLLLTWFLCDLYPDGLPAYTDDANSGSRPRLQGQGREAMADLEDRYRRQRGRLRMIAKELRTITTLLPRLPRTGSITRWAWSVARTRDVLAEEVARGRFAPAPAGGGVAVARDARVGASPVLDHCAHMMCNRLGVPIGGESVLRYLAGRTVFDLAKER